MEEEFSPDLEFYRAAFRKMCDAVQQANTLKEYYRDKASRLEDENVILKAEINRLQEGE